MMEDEKPIITEGRKLKHPPRENHFRSDDTKELHRQRLSAAMTEIWERRRAGEIVTRKPVKYKPPEKLPIGAAGRCKGCGVLADTIPTLEIHQRYCIDFQQYMKGIRSCTQISMKKGDGSK
jgi:hypothetical protein